MGPYEPNCGQQIGTPPLQPPPACTGLGMGVEGGRLKFQRASSSPTRPQQSECTVGGRGGGRPWPEAACYATPESPAAAAAVATAPPPCCATCTHLACCHDAGMGAYYPALAQEDCTCWEGARNDAVTPLNGHLIALGGSRMALLLMNRRSCMQGHTGGCRTPVLSCPFLDGPRCFAHLTAILQLP